jgi:hypothetical protein
MNKNTDALQSHYSAAKAAFFAAKKLVESSDSFHNAWLTSRQSALSAEQDALSAEQAALSAEQAA